ncbi:SGNH/GDSL hydrolase family protein [Nocardioides KLBMP 9356]|uniref:SGNH/GDSL hydrolase family protein n=1 Tax=Nocardioides potassii TaxID=2911371 RepID=A0ABS9H6M6_9ACTN|nr:SGNH/GDSL hydrolase family protein [Nocardioides potassii]MCF6376885.1 SGNH/GDSL hydrolase family protein [Nocardioides potassii]
MTVRRLLATGGGGTGGGTGGPPPPDPTLVVPRLMTEPLGVNQNTTTLTGSGKTWQHTAFTVLADSADMRLVFFGGSQGSITNPATLKASVRKAGGSWVPVTFSGSTSGSLPLDGYLTSDALTGPFLEATTFEVRVYSPAQNINVSAPAAVTTGEHLTETTLPSPDAFPANGPVPIGFIGDGRATALSLGLYGDSIAAQGLWWQQALASRAVAGVNFGRNAQRFTGRWLGADLIEALTHMLVQFGVNDLSDNINTTTMWARAVDNYDYIHGLNADLPLWQTTPTPIVDTDDGCATLSGQTVRDYAATYRQPWIAFLRDGAPCHPTTRAALSVGATGTVIRAGQTGHPLKGVVDIAAAVEQGGSSSPTGKWRVDLGALGGDGVHPSNLGMTAMVPPVQEWVESLSA